jgi:hypothetical protein
LPPNHIGIVPLVGRLEVNPSEPTKATGAKALAAPQNPATAKLVLYMIDPGLQVAGTREVV